MTRKTGARRVGFTLIEILVVVAIIAVLGGLFLGGAQRVRDAGMRTKVWKDISELATGISQFEAEFKIDYVPSRLRLREDGAYNPTIPIERDTHAFLRKCFPNSSLQGMDWAGRGGVTAGVYYDLEGWQCLVFCLGGIPERVYIPDPAGGPPIIKGKMRGFSDNPANPTNFFNPNNPSQPRRSIGPFFQFETARLFFTPTPSDPQRLFPGYLDFYGKPYAYFSSYKIKNGYDRYQRFPGGVSDCFLLGVSPYSETLPGMVPMQFHNPDSFQIISAGKNQVYGQGGKWPPVQNIGGEDDMSNFSGSILGSKP